MRPIRYPDKKQIVFWWSLSTSCFTIAVEAFIKSWYLPSVACGMLGFCFAVELAFAIKRESDRINK